MKFFSKTLSIGLFSLFLSDVHGADFQVNGDSIEKSKIDSQEWLSHGRTYDEQRFSELNQVNTENIDRLGIEWFADLDSNRGHEATPIVSDGVMFSTGAWSVYMLTMLLMGNYSGSLIQRCQKKKLILFVAM